MKIKKYRITQFRTPLCAYADVFRHNNTHWLCILLYNSLAYIKEIFNIIGCLQCDGPNTQLNLRWWINNFHTIFEGHTLLKDISSISRWPSQYIVGDIIQADRLHSHISRRSYRDWSPSLQGKRSHQAERGSDGDSADLSLCRRLRGHFISRLIVSLVDGSLRPFIEHGWSLRSVCLLVVLRRTGVDRTSALCQRLNT